MKRKNNVILIGFMGSGKTSVGLRLSYRLRIPVEDTDKIIAAEEGRKISEIFAAEGEEYFREKETLLLKRIKERDYSRIFSVGGGTPVRPENRELLRQCGTVVYLRIRPETVYRRLKGDTTRPLLQCENPLEKIKELMAVRRDAYQECADIVIDVDERGMEEILDEIVMQLPRYREHTGLQQEADAQERSAAYGGEGEGMKILVINGPNINFLGIRERSVYGTQDYQYLLNLIQEKGRQCGAEIEVFQSNHEGAIIDRIQESYFDGTEGIVINPGAYTHYSYAIRDALASITVPKVEIHISDITKREEFRKISVTAPSCDRQIYGQGLDGYLQAIDYILEK